MGPISDAVANFTDGAVGNGENFCAKPDPIAVGGSFNVPPDRSARSIQTDEIDRIPLRYRHSAWLHEDTAPVSRTMRARAIVCEPQASAQRRTQHYRR